MVKFGRSLTPGARTESSSQGRLASRMICFSTSYPGLVLIVAGVIDWETPLE